MRGWIAALVLMGCGQEYGMTSIVGVDGAPEAAPVRGAETVAPVARPVDEASPEVPEVWTALPSHGGSAVAVKQLEGSPVVEETHRFGSDAPTLTDVLFVVDGSTSMRSLVEAVREGMAALGDDDVFPPNTRIAVTNMTPRARTSNTVHPMVKRKGVMQLEPGFAGLVSAQRLADAREVLAGDEPRFQERLEAEGCDPWFAPGDRGPDGVSCLVAHTQILEAASEVEAGLLSAGLLALSDPELFRPGAAVNLVFVSDTHDPGLPPDHKHHDAMVAQRPDPARLAAGIAERFPVASVRMHAIAPAEPCTFETFDTPVYFEAAEATGGLALDICEATPDDYVRMMRAIAEEGSRPTQPVLALAAEAGAVDAVTVDGVEVPYTVRGRALTLDGGVPARAADVKVRYRAVPASMPRTR